MNRPWLIWSAFGACLAVVLSAMAWTTLTVLRLEDNAQRQAVREENVRLALWRMDSAVAPLLAQESAMPYFAYGAFYPARRSYADMFNLSAGNEPVLPSPLLTRGAPHAQLYFQFEPSGLLSSPQVPAKSRMKLAQEACALPEKVEEAARHLARLQTLVTRQQLLERLPSEKESDKNWVSFVYPGNFDAPAQNTLAIQNSIPLPANEKQAPAQSELPSKDNNSAPQNDNDSGAQKMDFKAAKQSKSSAEWQKREQINRDASQGYNNAIAINNFGNGNKSNVNIGTTAQQEPNAKLGTGNLTPVKLPNGTMACGPLAAGLLPASASAENVSQGMLNPLWIGETLLLARRVSVNGKIYVQGCWVDWPWLKQRLAGDVRDLLPDASLEPALDDDAERAPNRLAALPVKLNPGATIPMDAAETPEALTPVRISLVVAWICALLAAGAVAALLFGAVSLSERRGAFVSAVTHELRTPLTTFRMYAEMLAGGMVPNKEAQQSYLNTLSAEAGRLSHLVENVLAYARLERGSARSQVDRVSAQQLIDKIQPRLHERAAQAGLALSVNVPTDVAEIPLTTDVTAVEQILFNLVDNACKYAAHGDHKTLALTVARADSKLAFSLCDGGPGFSRQEARRLFRPFSKSARQAAHSAPGVGLGLALSRRLARDLHGDLALNSNVERGACFVLTLQAC